MYIQLIGRMDAEPCVAAETMPPVAVAAASASNARGRYGARCDLTAQGPTPGPPPPCGMQKVLCRLRWETSEPHLPGCARPSMALRLAPSVYTCPPCSWTISQISTTSSSNTPWLEG